MGLNDAAEVDVSGDFGGGTLLLGGDYQGKNPKIENAVMSVVGRNATINADAHERGNGGRIIVWSDETTAMQGTAYARGGKEGGDGGFVEVSGLDILHCSGHVNTTAPKGKVGDLLLDPSDIIIDTNATMDMMFDTTTGVFTPIADTPTLNNLELGLVLTNNMTNIIVATQSSFARPGQVNIVADVDVVSPFNLSILAESDINLDGGQLRNLGTGGFSLLSTGGSISLDTTFIAIETVQGNVTLTAAEDIILNPRISSKVVSSTSGAIIFNAGRDITIGNPGNIAFAFVEAVNGSIAFNAGRNFAMTAPNVAGQTVSVLSGGLGSSFNIGGSFIMRGGTTAGSFARIGGPGEKSSNMTFTIGGGVALIGGSGAGSHALIGLERGTTVGAITNSGDITFTSIGGDLDLVGGGGADSFAHIGHVDNQSALGTYTAVGSVIVNNIQGGVFLDAGVSSAGIGFGSEVTAGGDTYLGTVAVNGRGQIALSAIGALPSMIGFFVTGAGTSTVISERVSVIGKNVSLTGGPGGDAYIGLYSSNTTDTDAVINRVTVDARDSLILTPGTAPSFVDDGGAAIGAFSTSGTATANVFVNVAFGDLSMNASSGANGSFSRIVTSRSSDAGSNIVEIQARNVLVGNMGTNDDTAEIFGLGSVQTIADLNMMLNASSLIHSNGEVVLVVDNDKPNSPDIGNGLFILDSGAEITGGRVQIFTAQRSQNTIQAPINGVAFVPGIFFIDSDIEQWATYFPDNFGGDPFTIFYKTGLPETFNNYGRAIAEMFQNLKTYDELLFECKCFLLGYDSTCYNQLFHPKGMVSSFDLFGDETMNMLEQKYRNYHTKFVKSF